MSSDSQQEDVWVYVGVPEPESGNEEDGVIVEDFDRYGSTLADRHLPHAGEHPLVHVSLGDKHLYGRRKAPSVDTHKVRLDSRVPEVQVDGSAPDCSQL
jgi:hypothetical protein